jgi:hypothetical protein
MFTINPLFPNQAVTVVRVYDPARIVHSTNLKDIFHRVFCEENGFRTCQYIIDHTDIETNSPLVLEISVPPQLLNRGVRLDDAYTAAAGMIAREIVGGLFRDGWLSPAKIQITILNVVGGFNGETHFVRVFEVQKSPD